MTTANKQKQREREKQKLRATTKIRLFLSDGKPHQFNDIVSHTISRASVSKYLKEMTEKDEIIRTMDTSGAYPYPVYYKLKQPQPEFNNFINEAFASAKKSRY